jgi:hypothetical protein
VSDFEWSTEPFPHMVADGEWPHDLLFAVAGEFPDPSVPGWRRYANPNERKLEGPPGLWGPRTRELFEAIDARTPDLEKMFGIGGLHMETVGGGYHLIEPGGYLMVHTDFSRSPRTKRYRRLNFLIFLNEGWEDPGGHLELHWERTAESGGFVDVPPVFNRTVAFETSACSWHGHPKPASRWRKSVAAYFFTDDAPDGYRADQSTVWYADA